MADLEKVIKGLECCAHEAIGDCYNCPYNENTPYCDIDMMREAIVALKAQEPIAPNHVEDGNYETSGIVNHWFICGKCGSCVDPGDKYCRECGQAVKWE